MIAPWMIATLLVGAVVTVGALCAARIVHPRRWLWLAAMLLSIALPVAMASRPRAAATGSAPSVDASGASRSIIESDGRTRGPDMDAMLLIAWGALSLGLAVVFTATHWRTLAQLSSWEPRDVLGHSVTVSPDFGPAAVGLRHARVVVPAWVFEMSTEEQRLVLLHERQHVEAGDQVVLLAGVAMVVLMPWNLALWWQLRRLRIAMELDCDARVAPTARERPRYTELLLRVRSRQRAHRAALALVPSSSALVQRLHALLESSRPSRRQIVGWSSAALACVVGVARVPVPGMMRAALPGRADVLPIAEFPAAPDKGVGVSPKAGAARPASARGSKTRQEGASRAPAAAPADTQHVATQPNPSDTITAPAATVGRMVPMRPDSAQRAGDRPPVSGAPRAARGMRVVPPVVPPDSGHAGIGTAGARGARGVRVGG